MKPHVARVLLLEAKDLLAAGPIDLEDVLLPNMHNREGENRTETAALMAALIHGDKTSGPGKER